MSQAPGYQPEMSQPRPRPGAAPTPHNAPSFQSHPAYVDYGNPRAYDTSMRPASGLTGTRHAPAQMQRPDTAQPESAWATQTRRIQEVADEKEIVPFSKIAIWIATAVLGLIFIVVLLGFFALSLLSYGAAAVMWPMYAFFAGISLVVIIGVVVLADRWDPQPIGLLMIAVFWGAAVATAISFVVNTTVGLVAFSVSGSEAVAGFVGAVLSAPITEETTKGAGLLLLLFLARRYFNGPLDGVIYGALIGGGFAFTENIIYYERQFLAFDFGGMLLLVMIRGVVNIFGHAIYTSATGAIMGFVARKWGTVPGALSFVVALIPGMLMHAAWNFAAGIGSLGVLILMLVVQIVSSIVFIAFIGVLIWDEARLTRVRLGDYANHGWLTHDEVAMLATWKGRREGKKWAKSIGAQKQMKRFIREAADLAHVRQRLLADGQDPKAVSREAALLRRLSANRQSLLQASGQQNPQYA